MILAFINFIFLNFPRVNNIPMPALIKQEAKTTKATSTNGGKTGNDILNLLIYSI